MNATPATDKVKACCTSLTCGKVLLVNAARWKDGLPCPLCKKGTLVRFESTKTPMVPVVRVRNVPDPKPPAPPRIDEVPVVPVRVVPDPKPAAPPTATIPVAVVRHIPEPAPGPVATVQQIPETASKPVPVVRVKHIPDAAPAAEWLPAKPAVTLPTVLAPTAPVGPVPTVILAEHAPAPLPAQEVPDAILVGELVEEGADTETSGTYGLETIRTPPKCPKCRENLKPQTERCPDCGFDFRGDWERRLLDQNKTMQEIDEEKRRADALNATMDQHEQQERLRSAAAVAYMVGVGLP